MNWKREMLSQTQLPGPPFTKAVQRALETAQLQAIDDLLFLEAWEMHPTSHLGATLRASQIRRANPELAEAIKKELKTRR